MAKLSQPHQPSGAAAEDGCFDDAPTEKRNVPAELRDPHPSTYATAKLRRADIETMLVKERERSGMRPAVSDEDLQRYERRERRETMPAPPDSSSSRASGDGNDR